MDETLSTELLYGMILSGAKQIIHTEGQLNQLNVFPVADRDTGTNLASMMRYVVDNLSPAKDTPELLHQLSQHGLIGCCGNSGLIFSQFFYGLTQHKLTEKINIKVNEFVEMMSAGYTSAYNSVSNPKPGTILTVMDKWVESYREILQNAKVTLNDGFNNSVDRANEALKETMNQLEVLKANKVVDAGAQGFVNFLTGMQKFLVGTKEDRAKILADHQMENDGVKISSEFEDMTEIPDRRFCFETVIKTPDTNALDAYHERLDKLGNSMVVGKGPQMVKIHIHTNEPETVTDLLSNVGDIIYQKIDDMLMQYNIANKVKKSKVAIVADSMADIPEEVIQKYNIYRIPLQVKVNNNSFLDKISINYKKTLEYLADSKNHVGTAAPSAAIVARTFQFLDQFYDSIIVIPVGSGISSTHDVILNQARRYKGKVISVVDSGLNSAPLGLLVAHAASLAATGEHSHEEIIVKLEAMRKQANILVMLNSLDGLIRGGRISKSMGFVARLLRLKPLIQIVDGKPKLIGAAFSKRSAWRKLTKMINEMYEAGKIKSVAIAHTADQHRGEAFAKYIKRNTGLTPVYVTEASSVSGIHTDNNSYSIGYINHKITL